MFRMIAGGASLLLANSEAQHRIQAKRAKAARIKKNMPLVDAAIAQCRADREDAARRELARIAREVAEVQAAVDAIKAKAVAVATTVHAGNAYIGRF